MQNTITIKLPSTFTPYTLDTYGTFDFGNAESEVLENGENTERTYDDFTWEYDTNGYLLALATNNLKLQEANILDDVIVAINSDIKVISPREYNFTTDRMELTYTVDIDALHAFIESRKEHYEKNCLQSRDGFMYFGNEEQTMLNYYLEQVSAVNYTPHEYIGNQYEKVNASEFVTAAPINKEAPTKT